MQEGEIGLGGLADGEPAAAFAGKVLELAEKGLPAEEKEYLQVFYEVIEYGGIRRIPS